METRFLHLALLGSMITLGCSRVQFTGGGKEGDAQRNSSELAAENLSLQGSFTVVFSIPQSLIDRGQEDGDLWVAPIGTNSSEEDGPQLDSIWSALRRQMVGKFEGDEP